MKTPVDHRRDMVAVADQLVARACAASLLEPTNEAWPSRLERLMTWRERLVEEWSGAGLN